MPWNYVINIFEDELDNSFDEAFNFLLESCLIDKKILDKDLNDFNVLRFLIDTDDDDIICKNGKVYSKTKFLNNKSFKKKLIDHYKPQNIYVNGPLELIKRDGTGTNKWLVNLSRKY
jgi:hypothetical protein